MTEAKDSMTKDEAVGFLTEWNVAFMNAVKDGDYHMDLEVRQRVDALTTILTLMETHVLVPREVAQNAVKVCDMHVNLAKGAYGLDVTPIVWETHAALTTALKEDTHAT